MSKRGPRRITLPGPVRADHNPHNSQNSNSSKRYCDAHIRRPQRSDAFSLLPAIHERREQRTFVYKSSYMAGILLTAPYREACRIDGRFK
jgi:hypothetical protein